MAEQVLPHLGRRRREGKELVREILECDNPRVRREDTLSDGVSGSQDTEPCWMV